MKKKLLLGFIGIFLFLGFNGHNVWSESKYQIKKMTPEVEAALEGRRARYDLLASFIANKSVGENNQGYVTAMNDDSKVKSLVDQENKDRKLIYKTIAQQNGLESALDVIEKVFAQVHRESSGVGELYQTESGQWVTKGGQ